MALEMQRDIGKVTEQATVQSDVTVDAATLDGATGQETTYQNPNWSQQLGYYLKVPELKQSIDTRAMWVTGRGYTTDDPHTKVILERIRGAGEDTFLNIINNMLVVRRIGGDAYAEIIRTNDKAKTLLNIKPLDTGSMKIVVDKKGLLLRYEQVSKTPNGKTIKFKPTDIFRLTNKRIADSIGGISDIDVVEDIVKASNESFQDVKTVMHRHVKPIMAFKLKTDNQAKIDAFVAKMDNVLDKGKNIYIPSDTVSFELVTTPSSAVLNPMPWRNHLKDYFSQAVGIPQIVMDGSGSFTESGAKTAFTAFEQSIMAEKLEVEQQISRQLFHDIKFADSVSLRQDLVQDTAKDGANQGMAMKPSDLEVSEPGVKE